MTLNKIVIHWTGGTYEPNAIDRLHYHFLIAFNLKTKKAYIVKGKFKPEDNIDCKDGKYAEHCGGGNTGAISVSFCCMLGFKNSLNVGDYPLTKQQFELGCELIAELSKEFNIPVTPQTAMTHRVFGLTHPKTSSAGKIDICFIPYLPTLEANKIDGYIREKIQWYLNNEKRQ